MDTLEYDFFFKVLTENGSWLDETCFYFADDLDRREHWLGFLPGTEFPPYWAGNCDIPGGSEYGSAKELMEAPIFDGRSLRERWPQVRLSGMIGISLDSWYECYHGMNGGPCPRSRPLPSPPK